MRWIDNNRLALIGLVHVPDRPITRYSGQRIGKLVTLDTRTGKADWHEEFTGRFCQDGQNFTLSSTDDIYHPNTNTHEYHFWILKGVPGRLERKEVSREYLNTFDFTMACKAKDELPVPEWLQSAQKSGRIFTPLKPEHGWVEMAHARRPDGSLDKFSGMHPVRIYPTGDSEQGTPVEGLEQIDLSSIWSYWSFKNAYLLEEWVRGIPGTTGFVRSWWLHPDGRVEPALHYDRALRQGDTSWVENKIIPTRSGFLQVHERSYSRLPFANARTGLHLFRPDGSFKKLAGGRIELNSLTVSPDGCRVAFGADERYAEGREQYTLKLIDVCK